MAQNLQTSTRGKTRCSEIPALERWRILIHVAEHTFAISIDRVHHRLHRHVLVHKAHPNGSVERREFLCFVCAWSGTLARPEPANVSQPRLVTLLPKRPHVVELSVVGPEDGIVRRSIDIRELGSVSVRCVIKEERILTSPPIAMWPKL
jgi:hypothetical protein